MGEILFLAHRMPFPPDRGDKIRSHHLLRGLARIAPVHVGTFAETAQDWAHERALAALAKSQILLDRCKPLALAGAEALLAGKPVSVTAFASGAMRAWVDKVLATRPIETVFVFSGQMAQYVPDGFAGRVVVDLCDVDSAKFEAYAAAGDRRWLNAREARLLAEEEERIAHRAAATLLISDDEVELFRARLRDRAGTNVRVLGNGVDAEHFNPSRVAPHPALAQGAHCVFSGQMDYAPNVMAAQRFATRILPLVPGVHFHIVGRAPTDEVRALGQDERVTVWGEVPDVRPFLAAASVVMAPLAIARGVQNKVLEAMAMARPVVATTAAATGIAAADGTHFTVRDNDADFAAGLRELLDDPRRAAAMGAAARTFAIERVSWEAVHRELAVIVGEEARAARDAA